MHKSFLLGFFWLLSMCNISAQLYFEISPGTEQAYQMAINLKLDLAQDKVDQLRQSEPNNLIVDYIEDYIHFFKIMIDENEDDYKIFDKKRKARIKRVKKGNEDSPYYRLVIGEINLHWSLLRLKFNEKIKALREANNAYRYLDENLRLFPDFIETKKSLSMIHAMAESIPGLFRWALAIEGSIKQGTQEIKEVVDFASANQFEFKEEAEAIYIYILYFQNNKSQEAWNLLQDSKFLNPVTNPFASFLFAFFAQKMGENESCISYLENRPKGDVYYDFHYLDFILAKSKLYRLDEDADELILSFVNKFKGLHYIKEAFQKLAWYELVVNNDIEKYKYYMGEVLTKGNDLVDGDKQAMKEAKSNEIPNPILLKSRLLFDGGYYEKAYQIITRNAHLLENDSRNRLEYYYRLGRITHLQMNYSDAKKYYRKTIQEGQNSDSYLPCNSALQLGIIYEMDKEYEEAKKYFELCLDMDPDDYQNSLHQKANSGLDRIRGLQD